MIRVVCRRCGANLAVLETTLDDPRIGMLDSHVGGLESYLLPDPAENVVRVAVLCDDCLDWGQGGPDLLQ